MRVDRVGLAAVTAVSAPRGLHLHDDQAGCRDGTGQADAIAARSLQPHDYPRAGHVPGDPRDRLGEPVIVVADRQRGDRRPVRREHFQCVRIPVGVAADHGIDHPGKHRHPFQASFSRRFHEFPGLDGATGRHICDESRTAARTCF